MSNISRAEFVKIVAKEAGITQKAANITINLIYETLRQTVADQKSFVIPRVGTVKGILRPAKMGRNPKTGKPIMLREKLVVKIKSYFKEEDED